MTATTATSIERALAREPAWDSFVRGRLMNEEDVARLMKIADVARSLRLHGGTSTSSSSTFDDVDARTAREATRTMRATLLHHGDAVCETLLGTLQNVGAIDATEHVLALVSVVMFPKTWDDEEDGEGRRRAERIDGAVLFVNYGRGDGSSTSILGGDAYATLARTLERPDDASSWFIKDASSKALAAMIRARSKTPTEHEAMSVRAATKSLVLWCKRELQNASTRSASEDVVPAISAALSVVLEIPEARETAINENLIQLLTPVLQRSDKYSVQVMYEVALCFWLLSFNARGRREMCSRGGMTVKGLMACTAAASKEKVIRVSILALKNITDRSEKGGGSVDNFTAVDESLRKVVQSLSLRGFEDEELRSTLEELEEDLRARRKEASSWQRYKDEVMSGSLEWSAAHRDEGFWRECATKLTDNNCQILRVLIKLIDGSEVMDPRTLAVACHDIGEFAVHYPAGRFLANDLGGKEHSMRLMSHEDEEVRKSALQCVQKLLVSSWRSLNIDASSKE